MVKKHKPHYIPWIFRKVRRRIPVILLSTVLNVLISYSAVQFALTTKNVVNSAIGGDYDTLWRYAAILVALTLFRVFGSCLTNYLDINIREDLERDFKRSILQTILRTDYSVISRHHSGDLIQRMDADAAVVYEAVIGFFSGFTSIFVSIVAAAAALMQIAPGFTLIFVLVAGLFGCAMVFLRRILKQLSKDASAANGRVSGFLHETISKLMVVQALDMAEEVEQRTNQVLDDRWKIRRRQRNMQLFSRVGSSLLGTVGYLATMVWCSFQILAGRMTPGDLTAMTSLINTLEGSAVGLPMMLPRFFAITAACDRIMELEALPRQPDPDPAAARAMYEKMTGFTAADLTFAYDRDPVMHDVTLTIPKGGLTVIVGQSGIGKSTLLKLLLGLYQPDSGSLSIEMPEGPVNVDRSTRSLFSYAPQGNFLLSGTIRENLTFTNPRASEDEIRAALHASALDEYIDTLPLGLETVLMENGAGLSEGQAQRLSLARAILSGAPVLLLDEVTSALDAATEATVLERITALPGKTCIAVTHRPAALALAQNIIEVTENGMTISHSE